MTQHIPTLLSALSIAVASTAQEQFLNRNDDKEEEEENENNNDSSKTISLPHGHNAIHKTNGILQNNPNTWPIHSQEARRARQEFVRDGFRRLYAAASSGSGQLVSFRLEDAPGDTEDDGIVATAVRELGERFGRGRDNGRDRGEGEEDGISAHEQDWMCLPQ